MSCLICPECQYENVVVTCGFCLQCGIDLDTDLLESVPSNPQPVAVDAEISSIGTLATAVAERLDGSAIDGNGSWAVRIPTSPDRYQVIHFVPSAERTTLLSICGPALEQNALTLLMWNSQMGDSSFAARKINDRLMFVVTSHHMPEPGDLPGTVATVRSLGQLADRVEAKISSGADRH